MMKKSKPKRLTLMKSLNVLLALVLIFNFTIGDYSLIAEWEVDYMGIEAEAIMEGEPQPEGQPQPEGEPQPEGQPQLEGEPQPEGQPQPEATIIPTETPMVTAAVPTVLSAGWTVTYDFVGATLPAGLEAIEPAPVTNMTNMTKPTLSYNGQSIYPVSDMAMDRYNTVIEDNVAYHFVGWFDAHPEEFLTPESFYDLSSIGGYQTQFHSPWDTVLVTEDTTIYGYWISWELTADENPGQSVGEGSVDITKSLVDSNWSDYESGQATIEFTMEGSPIINGSDIIIVLDRSFSMSYSATDSNAESPVANLEDSRWYAATEAVKELTLNLLGNENKDNNRVGLVYFDGSSYSDEVDVEGSINLTVDSSVIIDSLAVTKLKKSDGNKSGGSTDYTSALDRAITYATGVKDDLKLPADTEGRQLQVIFISDGAPGSNGYSIGSNDWNGAVQAATLKNEFAAIIHTVGIGVDEENQQTYNGTRYTPKEYLEQVIAGNGGISQNLDLKNEAISDVLNNIVAEINPAAYNTTIRDTITAGFEILQVRDNFNNTYLPASFNTDSSPVIYDAVANEIIIESGSITSYTKKYYIDIKYKPISDPDGELVPNNALETNEGATLEYQVYPGGEKNVVSDKEVAEADRDPDTNYEVSDSLKSPTVAVGTKTEFEYEGLPTTVVPDGVTILNPPADVILPYGGVMTAPENLQEKGDKVTIDGEEYTFLGWFDEDGNEFDFTSTPTASSKVTGKWVAGDVPAVEDPRIITIDRTIGSDTVEINQPVEHEIVVSNTSKVELENLIITDKEFIGLEKSDIVLLDNTGAAIDFTLDAVTGSITVDKFPANSTLTATFTIAHSEADTGNLIECEATATAKLPADKEPVVGDILTATDKASATLTDTNPRELTVEKVGDLNTVYPGDTVEFTTTVTGDKDNTITNVTITDEDLKDKALEDITVEVRDSEGNIITDAVVSFDPVTGTVTVDELPAGGTITVVNSKTYTEETEAGKIVSSVTVEGEREDGTIAPEDTLIATDSAEIPFIPVRPAITVEKTAVDKVQVGKAAEYTVAITNAGMEDMSNVVVTDSVFAGLTVADIKVYQGETLLTTGYDFNEETDTLIIHSLKIGATIDVMYSYTNETPENFTNTVNVEVEYPSGTGEIVKATDSKDVEFSNPRVVTVDKNTDTTTIYPGIDVGITTTVTSQSDIDLENLEIVDKDLIGKDIADITLTDKAGNDVPFTFDPDTGTITVETLPAGEELTLEYTTTYDEETEAGKVVTDVNVKVELPTDETPLEGDVLTGEDTLETPFLPAIPSIEVEKTSVDTAVEGTPVDYTLTVTNTGYDVLNNVVVTDTVFQKFTDKAVVAITGANGSWSGNILTLDTIAPQAQVTITYSYGHNVATTFRNEVKVETADPIDPTIPLVDEAFKDVVFTQKVTTGGGNNDNDNGDRDPGTNEPEETIEPEETPQPEVTPELEVIPSTAPTVTSVPTVTPEPFNPVITLAPTLPPTTGDPELPEETGSPEQPPQPTAEGVVPEENNNNLQPTATPNTQVTPPYEPVIKEDVVVIPPTVEGDVAGNVTVDDEVIDENSYHIDENNNVIISKDFLAGLPDGEHSITIQFGDEIYESIVIMENGIPLSATKFVKLGGAWSLFDLVMTVLSAIFVIWFVLKKPKNKENDKDREEARKDGIYTSGNHEERIKNNKRNKTTVFLLLLAIFNIVLLILTQDFTLPIAIFDKYSIIFAVVVIVQIITMSIFKKKAEDEDSEETPQPAHS